MKSGVFFYGVGKDAIILTENLGLNYCCMKKELCKCAIPVIKIEKIMKILQEKNISFAIYYYTPKGINEIENILMMNKVEKGKRTYYLNKIDVYLNCQRIYLRIMYKNKWIDQKKFEVAISKIAEIGRIVGGLIKYYAKNY